MYGEEGTGSNARIMQLFLSVHSYVKREKEQRNAIYEKGEVPVSINCAEAFAPPLLQMNNAHW